MQGRCVRRVRAGRLEAGVSRFTWDGTDGDGRVLAAGAYFVRATVGDATFSEKVILAR